MSHLLIGNEESEFVKAEFRGRAFPDAKYSVERNMLVVGLDVAVRPFRAWYEATWITESFVTFRRELENLYANLGGSASFHPDWEGSLELEFSGDGLGHIEVKGTACANAALGPWLRFGLPMIDQTYLPSIIRTFRELETEFPIE